MKNKDLFQEWTDENSIIAPDYIDAIQFAEERIEDQIREYLSQMENLKTDAYNRKDMDLLLGMLRECRRKPLARKVDKARWDIEFNTGAVSEPGFFQATA